MALSRENSIAKDMTGRPILRDSEEHKQLLILEEEQAKNPTLGDKISKAIDSTIENSKPMTEAIKKEAAKKFEEAKPIVHAVKKEVAKKVEVVKPMVASVKEDISKKVEAAKADYEKDKMEEELSTVKVTDK